MPANQDFKELLSIFNEENVEYLVVGAHAVMYYTEPRYTKDVDVWVRPSADNAQRVYRALKRFGAPLANISADDFSDPDLVYQLGVAPNRIDIMMGIAGVDFDAAWPDRVESTYDGVPMHIISKRHLIQAKKACGRKQDELDLERLG